MSSTSDHKLQSLSELLKELYSRSDELATDLPDGIASVIKQLRQEYDNFSQKTLCRRETIESEYQRYRDLFNYAPDSYLVTDPYGYIQEANQAAFTLLSATLENLIGRSIIEFIPESERNDFGLQLNWLSNFQQMEVSLRSLSGSIFFASLSVTPRKDSLNKIIGLYWLIRDISEHKLLEKALAQSEKLFHTSIENMLDCFGAYSAVRDENQNIIDFIVSYVNDAACIFNEMTREEQTGKYLCELLPQIKENGLFKDYIHVVETGELLAKEQVSRENNLITKAHEIKAVKMGDGLITFWRDITARKKAEEALQRSEKFTSSLLENSPNPILVLNQNTSVRFVNHALENITGFTFSDIFGIKTPYPWSVNEECTKKHLTAFKKDLHRGKIKNRETLLKKKNGELFWVEANSCIVRNDLEPDYYMITWTDITEAKRLRENMEFFVKEVTRSQEEERRRIARELHEEILQSLAALCLGVEAIIKDRTLKSNNTITSLQELREKINEVLENVRRFSYELRPGALDYLGLEASLESLTEEIKESGTDIQLMISGSEHTLSPEMEISLFRIVQESLNNVKKHAQASKIMVTLKFGSGNVKLTVSDNGNGFKVPKLLSDFASDGHLGLTGIAERVRLLGGNLSIKSKPKSGTKISITVPFRPKILTKRQSAGV